MRGPRVTAFDVELLVVGRRLGYRIRSVPVAWTYGSQSKVNPVRDTLNNFADVVRVKWNDVYVAAMTDSAALEPHSHQCLIASSASVPPLVPCSASTGAPYLVSEVRSPVIDEERNDGVEGDMREFPLAEILQFISLGSRTGVLEIVRRDGVYGVIFTSGTITGLTADGWTLAQELRDSNLLPPDVLTGLLSINTTIQDLRAAILTGGYMTADEWTAFVSRQVERLLYSLFDVRDGRFRFRQSATDRRSMAAGPRLRRPRGTRRHPLERNLVPRRRCRPLPPNPIRADRFGSPSADP